MLDYDTHSRLADATTELMRSCAVAAAQTMTASTCRGLMLWSDMLRAPDRRPAPQAIRTTATNPFEVFWRFTPADWMPKASVWPQGYAMRYWLPGPALGSGLGATLCHLARDFRLVGLEPRLLAGVAKPTATGEPIRRAGHGDARRAEDGVTLDLCQLPVRGRACRGTGHHDAQRRYGGGRADRDEPRPHADAHHAQHMAHRARRLGRDRFGITDGSTGAGRAGAA